MAKALGEQDHGELEVGCRRGWCVWSTAPFPADAKQAFLAFCDAAWCYASALVQQGRKVGLETVFLTQRPNPLNESILGEVTECVAFPLTGERGLLKVVNTCDVPDAEVDAPDHGQFVSVTDRGGVLRGRVF